jgi:lipopolysaccharide transport system permease protein
VTREAGLLPRQDAGRQPGDQTRLARPAKRPRGIVDSVWAHRELVWQLTRREVLGRYRGSLLGVAWAVGNPLLMLAVYTLVFGYIFRARWGAGVDTTGEFALVLFCGLTVFGIFSEVVSRAPALILSNPSYVKKVVFPIDCLPWVLLGAALFHAAASLAVLLLANAVLRGVVPWTAVLLPIVLLPLLLLALGLAWALAALGVYLRDIGHLVNALLTVLLFLSPVFYPASSLPEPIHRLIMLNPLTAVLESARAVLLWGQQPDWLLLLPCTLVAALVAWLGWLWFDRTRSGFADVL